MGAVFKIVEIVMKHGMSLLRFIFMIGLSSLGLTDILKLFCGLICPSIIHIMFHKHYKIADVLFMPFLQ